MYPPDNSSARWAIRHLTIYRYTVPVAFATHLLRLTPRPDTARLVSRSLDIEPAPLRVDDFTDQYGNVCTRVELGPEQWFELRIESRVEVENFAPPQPTASLASLPWLAPLADGLAAFRAHDGDASVAALARRVLSEAGPAPLAFFQHLNHTLYTTIDRQLRLDGAAQTAAQTLATLRGACRDLTVLFLAVCRSVGVAGRFVSGYQGQEQTPDGRRHLHAWPEVFVPDLGWLGWDPTHGIPVGAGHVALCVAPSQAETMPIEGGFFFNGSDVTSTLDYEIDFAPF